jgi:hypothetical protein
MFKPSHRDIETDRSDIFWCTANDRSNMNDVQLVKTSTPRNRFQAFPANPNQSTSVDLNDSLSYIDLDFKLKFLSDTAASPLQPSNSESSTSLFCNLTEKNLDSIRPSPNDTTNKTSAMSWEKLSVLKPQSNNYVICFNMSMSNTTDDGDPMYSAFADFDKVYDDIDQLSGFDSGLETSRVLTTF